MAPGLADKALRRSHPEALVQVFDCFEEAQGPWAQLEPHADFVFQRSSWLEAWYQTCGNAPGIQPCIAVVHVSNTPVMLLPLGVERRAGVDCVVFLGGPISDYQAPILGPQFAEFGGEDPVVFAGWWAAVRRALPPHGAVIFERLPEVVGGRRNPLVDLGSQPHASSAHIAHLEQDLQSFLLKRRSKKTLSTERRKRRKLEKLGRLSFRVASTWDEAAPLLAAMLRQKSENYRELGVEDLFAVEANRSFIRRVTQEEVAGGFVHLSALLLDDKVIATHWGLIHRGRLYYIFPAYERGELERHSPGNILLHELLQWCFDHDVAMLDFTVGDEPYKYHWRDTELPLFDMIKAESFWAQRYVAPLRLSRIVKRRVKQSPQLFDFAVRVRSRAAELRRRLSGGESPRD